VNDGREYSSGSFGGKWLTSACANDLGKSLAKDLFCWRWFLDLWLGESFVELVPIANTLSFNDVFATSVVFDWSVFCFSIEFVPIF
jgi:hypothetical protein